jgi:fluoroacetyl-CoA thioesterase
MKASLVPGIVYEKAFTVPENKTVPHLFPEAPEFQSMPHVLATGYLVGLIEWSCIEALKPHIDWPAEQTVGTRIDISHSAATPPGLTVTVTVELVEVDRRRLRFAVAAHDGVDTITRGFHERFAIDAEGFKKGLSRKTPA